MERKMSSSSVASSSASGGRAPVARKASMPTCILCCNAIDNASRFRTVGACGHTSCCSVCALRMRQLMGSLSCAMCKTELPRVICIERESDAFESFQDWGDDNIGPTHVFDEASAMFFLKDDYHTHVRKLRDPICAKCGKKFATVQALKTHVLDVHQVQFCGICLEFKKIFLGEHTLFTKEQLKRHNTRGDPREGFTGHPRCDFCFSRFYSNPELYEHLHKNHFECDICLHSMHIENRYYKNYPDLENHFRADHFLCEEPVCLSKKFVVFKSHIDLQGHMANEHPHIKTSRKIDVHFKIRRASEDNMDDPYDQYGRSAGFSGAGDSNVINVADFPSLSESGGQNSGSLFWENHSSARHPQTEDFPALQSSSAGSGARGGRSGPAGFRNALVPPPSLALQAHFDNSSNWEYPELASAAAALGANNPLMRFVKPAKKNKKGKKGGGGGGTTPPNGSARSAPAASAVDEYEEKAAAEESNEEEAEDYEEVAPSSGAESKSSIVLKISNVLGGSAKYEVFRRDCRAFRDGEVELSAFYAKMHSQFSPEDFEKLFLRLMRLSPDKEQVNKFFAHHKQVTKAAADSEGFQEPSSKKNKQKKSTPKAAKAAAPVNNKKTPSPSHSGWSSALKDAGLGGVTGNSSGRKPAVIVHNTNTREILGRDDKAKTVWHSSTSWQAPVAAAAPAVGATPVTTKIQTAPINSFAALSVAASPAPSSSYANSVAGAARSSSAPSGSFKVAKSDFPDLPKAGKPVGVQPVTRATWDDHAQAIAQNRTQTQTNGNTGGGKKKQKKKSMTLAEMAMHFG